MKNRNPFLPRYVSAVLLHLLLLVVTSSLANDSITDHGVVQPAQPAKHAVKVLVCTEALCPDCERFVTEQLVPVYELLGSLVMDLDMIPFGNAHLETDDNNNNNNNNNVKVECQHGKGECDANAYELCAIYMNPDPKDYLPFLACLAQSLPMGHHEEPFDSKLFQQCATTATSTVWWSGIEACHDTTSVVRYLMEQAAERTPNEHKYVPWIEIEGTPMEEERADFKTEICKAFVANGGSHPACSDAALLL